MDDIFGFSGSRGSKWTIHMIILNMGNPRYEFCFKILLKKLKQENKRDFVKKKGKGWRARGLLAQGLSLACLGLAACRHARAVDLEVDGLDGLIPLWPRFEMEEGKRTEDDDDGVARRRDNVDSDDWGPCLEALVAGDDPADRGKTI